MPTESCPRCVLLIEDDEALRQAIGAFLDARGYTTMSADNGERAVELLLSTDLARPCLVLADLITQRIDWASLMSALQPDDRLATLPMALVRVSTQTLQRVKKPVAFDLLARIVKEHCCGDDGGGEKPRGSRDVTHGSGCP